MWQTSSGIKEDNFDFVSKFDMLKRWSPSSLFTTPNGKRGVTRTCFKCLENIILRMKHVLPTALLIWNDDFSDSVPPQLFKRRGSRVKILFQYHLSGSKFFYFFWGLVLFKFFEIHRFGAQPPSPKVPIKWNEKHQKSVSYRYFVTYFFHFAKNDQFWLF